MRFYNALVLLLRLLLIYWPLNVLLLADYLMVGTVLDGVVVVVEHLQVGTNIFGLVTPTEFTFVLLT